MAKKYIPGARITVAGDTYAHREAIKAVGGEWDTKQKVWRVPESEWSKLAHLPGLERGDQKTFTPSPVARMENFPVLRRPTFTPLEGKEQ